MPDTSPTRRSWRDRGKKTRRIGGLVLFSIFLCTFPLPLRHNLLTQSKKEESESSSEESESGSEESGSESGSGDEAAGGPKKGSAGVVPLAEMANPNREVKKNKKIGELDTAEKAPLSRREREEIEKQRAKEHYQKLHAQGKTDEARADLARLAIIRQQREEAAKKREMEKQLKAQGGK